MIRVLHSSFRRVLHSSCQRWASSKVYLQSYGCQMNIADSEVVLAILKDHDIHRTMKEEEADIVLVNTCSVREKAEQRVWTRLHQIRAHLVEPKQRKGEKVVVGLLGCMASRVRKGLLKVDRGVALDFVARPGAYRDIPRLIQQAREKTSKSTMWEETMDQLRSDEMYEHILPHRLEENNPLFATVVISRGCSNRCAYCVVPGSRGPEISRPWPLIEREVWRLKEQGVREILLLGQNVNAYFDRERGTQERALSHGFQGSTRGRPGIDFASLLEKVAVVDPSMRVRFTSPHPAHFPDAVLDTIARHANVGSTQVLQRMRRGYTRDQYLSLVERIRKVIPEVALSTDIISGFCGETEQDHLDTLRMMHEVEFDAAFMFAYSERSGTEAFRKIKDDVESEVKIRRLKEVIDTFHRLALKKSTSLVNSEQIVLVEGRNQKQTSDWMGRTDGNRMVFFPTPPQSISSGEYAVVRITSVSSVALRGEWMRTHSME